GARKRSSSTSILFSLHSLPELAAYHARGDGRSSRALLSKATCTVAQMEQATLPRWCTTESNTESWPPTPKDCPCCARQTLANNSKVLMPKPLRYAIRNTTSTTSICETWPKYGGGEV